MRCTNSWGAPSRLGIEISWAEEKLTLNILNIYGPYNNRVEFWETLKNSIIIQKENLIIGGDLNFTLGVHEIWDIRKRKDPLASFFSNLLHNLKMVDLDPQNLKPS